MTTAVATVHSLRERRWLLPALLATPFLIGVALLQGLTLELETFHSTDARSYHLPTIELFAGQLPSPDLGDYPAAQTPLFHLLFAAWGEVVGAELWRLQLLNVLISYGAVLALFRLLQEAFELERPQAFALALLFGLSPYFFGASFILLTDNLAILFGLVALERFHRFSRDGSVATFALGCLAMGAAVLTRQSFLWLAAVAAFFVLRSAAPLARRAALAAVAGLALAPFAALVVEWRGLVPPGADPASCGLCADPGAGRADLTLRTVAFTVAVLGLYAAAIWWPVLLRRARALWPPPPGVLLPVAAGAALLVAQPLLYDPVVPGVGGDAGYLWRVSDRFPDVGGSSLVFWPLVALGALAIWQLGRRAGFGSLPIVYLAAFLLAALPVRLVYQKYFDPFALLALVMLVRPQDLRERTDYAGIALLAVGFVAYAVTFEV